MPPWSPGGIFDSAESERGQLQYTKSHQFPQNQVQYNDPINELFCLFWFLCNLQYTNVYSSQGGQELAVVMHSVSIFTRLKMLALQLVKQHHHLQQDLPLLTAKNSHPTYFHVEFPLHAAKEPPTYLHVDFPLHTAKDPTSCRVPLPPPSKK